MNVLERVFSRREEQCAVLYAVAGYLSQLNEFASKKRSTAMIEYNVGGVAAIVEHVQKLANNCAGRKMHFTEEMVNDLVDLLCRAWYIREDGTVSIERARSAQTQRDYYNAELDVNGSMFVAVAQILTALEDAVDGTTAALFHSSSNLLRRYAGFARTGSEHEAHFDDETGDEFYSLLRFFRSLYKMRQIELKSNLAKAQELRKQGNEVFKSGRFGAAIAKYTEALILDPTSYIIYSNRAAAYTYLNATDNAISDLKQAIELKNDYETAWARLGFSYLAKGNALESVKAYIKAIELSDLNGSLEQYIGKLVQSLSYAEQRALSQGVSRAELNRLTSTIRSIRSRFTLQTRQVPYQQDTFVNGGAAGVAAPQEQQQAQPPQFPTGQAGEPNTPTFQVFTDGADGNDVFRQALNFMGTIIDVPAGAGGAAQGGNATANFLGNMFGQNPETAGTPQQQQQQQQQPQQNQQQNGQAQAPQNGDAAQAGEPVDQDMEDPDTSVPPEEPQNNNTNTNDNANGQNPLHGVFMNVIPETLRQTVGPMLLNTLNSALSGGAQGQGATFTSVTFDQNGRPVNVNSSSTNSNMANANGNAGNSSDSGTPMAQNSSSTSGATTSSFAQSGQQASPVPDDIVHDDLDLD